MHMSAASPASAIERAEETISEEHFSLEHLEAHARRLASELTVTSDTGQAREFLSRVLDDAKSLRESHRLIARSAAAGEPASGDAEWLLDNFSIVEEQLREILEDLPRGFYRELPKLSDGRPRIYRLSLELIAHTNSALDEETLLRFLSAFQEVKPLSIGETWAFPIMLRLALVENLRRIAAQMVANRDCRRAAAEAIEKSLAAEHVKIDVEALEHCAPTLLELLEQLEVLGGEGSSQLKELERRLAKRGWEPNEIVRIAHRRQAANQVKIGNVITGMRLLSALDWMAFFEQTNPAERELRRDPAQTYTSMDLPTRDRYRRATERMAKRSDMSDVEVSRRAVARAAEAADRQAPLRERHVGYYLIGDGRLAFQQSLNYRPSFEEAIREAVYAHPATFYLGGMAVVTAALLAILIAGTLAAGGSVAAATFMSLLALLPAMEIAVGVMNLIVTSWLPPRVLAKLEFKDGVPTSHATLVVVPSMLTSEKEVESLVHRLELHYLANPEPNLKFGLVTDFVDADQPTTPADAAFVARATAEIQALNERYAPQGGGPFYLFHRRRQWNECEGRWMGWERKRGKLMELNRLLYGRPTSFDTIVGDSAAIAARDGKPAFKFIITLDADTQLPPATARRMIGALAHPLNRPQFDGDRVTSGYVLLQPRVGITLGSATRSWYARLFANSPGIDPYSTAASDMYQDLFGEGSFTGKGIYDLAAFERALDGAFPENHILSHDLIEGCHSRVGLVSDIEVIDGFPTRYDAEVKRQHRWARGDWQLLPWLLPRTPSEHAWSANRLTLLSKWKVSDNMRRSLVAPAMTTFLVVGWLAFPKLALFWSGTMLGVLALPLLAQLFTTLRHLPGETRWREYRRGWMEEIGRTFVQTLLQVVLLPHRAISMLDALVRTMWRMLVSRRKMLEWEAAAATEARLSSAKRFGLPLLWFAPLLGLVLLFITPAAALPAAAIWIAAWIAAPLAAHWLNQPCLVRETGLTEDDRRYLRLAARRTWSYFEHYVTAEDNWLPPDNVQEYPSEKVAHRVSPTNEGLFLLSALAAREFGYIPLHGLAELWENNLATWMKFDRLNGHWFNWYETTTLRALPPRYLSTVDSGNLAVSFLTMKVGIDEMRPRELFTPAQWQGVLDTVETLNDACRKLQPRGARIVSPPLDNLVEAAAAIGACSEAPHTLNEWRLRLKAVRAQAVRLAERTDELVASRAFPWTDAPALARGLVTLVEGLAHDFDTLFAWFDPVAAHAVFPEAPLTTLPPPFPLSAESDRQSWSLILQEMNGARTLGSLSTLYERTAAALQSLHVAWQVLPQADAAEEWVARLRTALSRSSFAARELDDRLERIGARVEKAALEMNFTFLYNSQRRLFSIGFNLEDGQLDRSHYDMLASEVRLASYFAIAKGDVDHRTWFRMGRGLIQAAGQVGVISWGGTMFEYLMPQLFHREYDGSLISASVRMAVARQIEHGRAFGVPWGVSESAFSALAGNSDYHYQSFGVPGLGLKRGLGKDLVISPYSTFLALEVEPQRAVANLHALEKEGALGTWGFYEAIDYTPERLPSDKRSLVVRCFMAHHLGMSMLALANILQDGVVRRRFHEHPFGRAGELLLQERVPAVAPLVEPPDSETTNEHIPRAETDLVSRRLIGYDSPAPRTQLLSNGHYAVMVTGTGGGYSKYHDLTITRWRSDPTCDDWGQFIYLKDVTTGRTWSATYQPTRAKPEAYQVTYSIDKAEFQRRDGRLETHLEIAVSPEHSAEVRHLKLTNHGSAAIEIEVTSYAEITLCPANADAAHPAFQKLFVETEFLPQANAILARRRPRDAKEKAPWAAHVLAAGAGAMLQGKVEYESSREKFLGRGGTLANPAALADDARLTGSVGAVLDPIFSLRCRVTVPPHESAAVAFTTIYAPTREEAVSLAETYHELRGVLRAFEMAWAFNQVALRHLHLSPAKAHLFQRLAAALLYPDPSRRADAETLLANRQGQSGLWKYGISGDNPILLLHVTKPEQIETVRDLLTAHRYWREHRFLADLVIINDNPGSYIDALQEQLVNVVNELLHQPQPGPTHVALLRGAQLPPEDKVLLETAASVVLHGVRGALTKQMEPARVVNEPQIKPTKAAVVVKPPLPPPRVPNLTAEPRANASLNGAAQELLFANGIGGFSPDGKEYRLIVSGDRRPPKAWSNILANPRFGCLVTDSGGGYTWAENSREFKLTRWANDPLLDTPSELLYLRDEKSQDILRPLPQRVKSGETYHVAHGHGYSRFELERSGLKLETTIAVAGDDPVKLIRVTIVNRGSETRRLALTYLAEWVLGVNREQTQLYVNTSWDDDAAALLATNAYHPELASQIAFLTVVAGETSWCGDRAEFVGRNGDPAEPAALKQPKLSGKTGPGLDPCGAVQTSFVVAANERWTVTFLLGAGANLEEVRQLVAKYRQPSAVDDALQQVSDHWGAKLGALQVKTPNKALDLLVNHWLLYQTIACRIWARAALYQAGGAYGFRDQLQDVMACVYAAPELARAQLLRAAARQFVEGDVQHWWHPPLGRGTRTRFSDDYLWLPLVACHYLKTTGDRSVLDETAGFIRSPLLEPHEHERYELPTKSPESASLYEHCRRTVTRAFNLGPHGLPLIGCGDWNDGMNKIGELGQGESVWVGWFLLVILREFLPVMRERGDNAQADELAAKAERLRQALETQAWDGGWYRRAFFDDGTPLGSAQNDECQIDSIAQSWAVFAGAPEERTRRAMQAVSEKLIRRNGKLVLLFAPAFDKTPLDPGYIKGYLPGIRENGGQYTHPALWVIQAFAELGDVDAAFEVFDLINPIHHSASAADCAIYQVEPYVVAADVYGVPPHVGRGGWTWYTGSSAWMYRTAVESLLGFQLRGDRLTITPRVPQDWPQFEVTYRRGKTTYHIVVHSPGKLGSPPQITLDGRVLKSGEIPLANDGATHEVVVVSRPL